jgi:hypothetical protein
VSGYRLWSLIYPWFPVLVLGWIAWRHPGVGGTLFRRGEGWLGCIARQPLKAAGMLAALSLALSLTFAILVRFPQPVIADEFSYLLAAETFREGRVSNPPPPSWPHFESLHVLMQPTWASKYPPAQGLVLAMGWKVGGAPIVGVWISLALGCLAIYWMLRGWVRAREALIGGLLAVFHPMLLEWGQNYWGGAVAMGGGALVLGACGRLRHERSVRSGAIFGLGLAILAASRPFEGGVFGLLCGIICIPSLRREGGRAWGGTIVAAGAVLAPTLFLLAIYHNHVTGSPWKMPYQVHEETYAVAPPFLWQSPAEPPPYRHASLEQFYTGYALETYLVQQTLRGWLHRGLVRKAGILLRGYAGTLAIAVPLLFLPWGLRSRDRVMQIAATLLGLFLIILLGETWILPHYAAPAAGVLFLLTVRGWHRLRCWRPGGKRRGLWIARSSLLLGLLGVLHLGLRIDRAAKGEWAWATERSAVAQQLTLRDSSPGAPNKWLVLVRYGPTHNPHEEWVYNSIDLAASPVLWAREMDPASNRQLRALFADRQCRVLLVERGGPQLLPCQEIDTPPKML